MNDEELINKLQEIKTKVVRLAFNDTSEKDRIEKLLKMFITKIFGENSEYLEDVKVVEFYFHPLIMGLRDDYTNEDKKSWEGGKKKWCNLIDVMVEELICFPSEQEFPGATTIQMTDSEKSKKIFIVHGHDDEMVHAVGRFVKKIGYEPVILREQPNQGRTIIEKFEDYADVPYAIVLFTPDDLGRAKDKNNLQPRPRQNVIFELGFFIGKLGRDKVVVLHKVVEKFEMLSDFNGVLFQPYKSGWEMLVANEIKSVGFDIDVNNLVQSIGY